MTTKNYMGAAGLPAIFSASRLLYPPDSIGPDGIGIDLRTVFLPAREWCGAVELYEPMCELRQITFIRIEMTVKFPVEWGPVRMPPRARRVPASHANSSNIMARRPPVDSSPSDVRHRETFEVFST
jgi:hypothetical protein